MHVIDLKLTPAFFLLLSLRNPEAPSLTIRMPLSARLRVFVEFYQLHLLVRPPPPPAATEMKGCGWFAPPV